MIESRRVHERIARELHVILVYDGKTLEGHTTNVSLGGLFIATTESIPYGTSAKVRLTLPALKEETEMPVTIRWATHEGVGVQFGSLRAREVWALNQLMK